MLTPNDEKPNYPFVILKLLVEPLELDIQLNEQINQNLTKIPNDFLDNE